VRKATHKTLSLSKWYVNLLIYRSNCFNFLFYREIAGMKSVILAFILVELIMSSQTQFLVKNWGQ